MIQKNEDFQLLSTPLENISTQKSTQKRNIAEAPKNVVHSL